MKYDFGGFATKHNIKCADGRTIKPDAFKHMDGKRVPLVWQHQHNSPDNVLGHAVLENRPEGVYTYAIFNDTEAGKNAKLLVEHGDIDALSIYANKLVEKSKNVLHGFIREVSLVLSGANPGALIDNLLIEHADGEPTIVPEEVVIYSGAQLDTDDVEFEIEHAEGDDETVKDVFETFTDKQKDVFYALLAEVVEGSEGEVKQSGIEEDDDEGEEGDVKHSIGGKIMKKNVFDKTLGKEEETKTLTHAQIKTIMDDAQSIGSLEQAILKHAGTYGIDNIDFLFPDAKTVRATPDWIKRDTGWVAGWMGGTHHTPFSRIKSMTADITADEARAKGYVKGNEKLDEVFGLLKRTTEPQTVYKKQKLDRDDIIDITSFDVVAWLKGEMRLMLNEEIARAGLIGDGRSAVSDDKIKEDKIRPIYSDAPLYAPREVIAASVTSPMDEIEAVIRARKNWKGTGRPTFYMTSDKLVDWLLCKDSTNRRIYKNQAELEADLRVSKIEEVEVMENVSRMEVIATVETDIDLIGIMVNPYDYTYGADKGGKVAMFDDFDIDFNQQKYLIEGRTSGALTKPESALIVEKIRVAG